MEDRSRRQTRKILSMPRRRQVKIDTLPNVALLKIFGFYLSEPYTSWHTLVHTLVHVCRRWRNVIFRSPDRLNLQISCTFRRPFRTARALDIWPSFPIRIYGNEDHLPMGGDVDNIVTALGHKDRVCEINLSNVSSSNLEKYLAAMGEGEPFLALTSLELEWIDDEMGNKNALGPNSFLGGSAPRLRTLTLNGIPLPFLGLQKLLLSSVDLVHLHLGDIPHSVYFSPEAIVTALSALSKLEQLGLTFQSHRSRPIRENRRPPPPTRTLLPSLTWMTFKGINEYLEDTVAQIDAPLLGSLTITFFHQLAFDTRQLAQFIGRAPKLQGHNEARVVFSKHTVWVIFFLPSQVLSFEREIQLEVPCKHTDLQLLSVTQLCTLSPQKAFIPTVEHLYIVERSYQERPHWENDIQMSQWLELLRPFTAVKDLYLSEKIVPLIAPALRELVRERRTEVLPVLQCLLLEGLHTFGPVMAAIKPFIAARQQSTHPIAASYWDRAMDGWDGESLNDNNC